MKQSTEYKMAHKKDFGKEKIEILYEDSYLMILLKPSGILSAPYPGSRAKTVLDIVELIMRKKGSYSKNHKPLIVHRLDRDTSGVMMLAMTEAAQKKIMDSWHQMVTERLYRAVAENPRSGNPHSSANISALQILPDSGIIDAPLAYNAHTIGFVPSEDSVPRASALKIKRRQLESRSYDNLYKSRSKQHESSIYERNLEIKNGKAVFKTVSARTHFKVIERGNAHTLFELSLDTGRKNQIRAHLASKGYPLAGDENYRAKTDPFGRLALHARTLEFDHPFTGEHLKFEVPEPEEWLDYVKNKSSFSDFAVWAKNPRNSKICISKSGRSNLHANEMHCGNPHGSKTRTAAPQNTIEAQRKRKNPQRNQTATHKGKKLHT